MPYYHQNNQMVYNGESSSATSSVRPKPADILLNPRDLCVGAIPWLLPREKCEEEEIVCTRKDYHLADSDTACHNSPMRAGAYDHPVCVIAIKQRPGSDLEGDLICTIISLDTWSSTNILTYFQVKFHLIKFKDSAPIWFPGGGMPFQGALQCHPNHPFLFLESGQLYTQSYANYQHTYDVPIKFLRAFASKRYPHAYDVRLTEASYESLMKLCNLTPEAYLGKEEITNCWPFRLEIFACLGDTDEARIAILHRQFYDAQENTEPNTAYSSSDTWQLLSGLQVPSASERLLLVDLQVQDPIIARMVDMCRIALSADYWDRISPVLRQIPTTNYDLKFVPYPDWKVADNSPEWMAGTIICRVKLEIGWEEDI